jgi:hypothetical protein
MKTKKHYNPINLSYYFSHHYMQKNEKNVIIEKNYNRIERKIQKLIQEKRQS